MIRLPRLSRWQPALALLALAALSAPGTARAALTIGSSNPATADPTVPRPATTPCTVPLFTNKTFADF